MREELLWAQRSYIVKPIDGTWSTVRGQLPAEWYRKHMNGGPRYGVPLVRGRECHAAMLDLDDHDGSVGWDAVVELAQRVMNALFEHGLVGVPFRSGGGRGINIWMIWEQPQVARDVRVVLYQLVSDLGMRPGTGGVANRQIEVYPAQDEVDGEDLGNHVAFPRTALDPWSLEDCKLEEADEHWAYSEPVDATGLDFCDEEVGSGVVLSAEQIDELLGWIANDDLDYDDWIKCLAAIHGAGGTLEQALAWSSRSSKNDDDETERKWKSFKRKAGKVASGGTLMMLASAGGWGGWPANLAVFPSAPVAYKVVATKGRYQGYKVADPEQLRTCALLDPDFPYHVAFDEFTQDVIMINRSTGEMERLKDTHYYAIRVWFAKNKWEPVSTNEVRELIKFVAFEHRINVAIQWAAGLVWDGVDRYPDLLRAMGITPDAYHLAACRYWWSAHGGRVVQPGAKADAIIVLQSSEQGVGKTLFIETIAPQIGPFTTYRDVLVDHLLNDDKSARAMRGALCANLDEMRSMSKREAAEVKAALSKRFESYIPKYVENRSEFGRQCVLYGTSNEHDILDDHTGNRRFHIFAVGRIDIDWVAANRDQLWAQGVAQFKTDGIAWQEANELAEPMRQEFSVDTEDVWTNKVVEWLETATDFHDGYRISDVLTHAIGMEVEKQTKSYANRVAKIFRALGYKRTTANRDQTGKQYSLWKK
jgi:hypothetical protein